jgi:hypothetical protein
MQILKTRTTSGKSHLLRQVKKSYKAYFLYLPMLCMILLHMPVTFAKTMSNVPVTEKDAEKNNSLLNKTTAGNVIPDEKVAVAYENMHLHDLGLSETAFNYAMKGFNYLVQQGKLAKDNIISIADFSQPSSKKRLYVIDLNESRVLFNTYVAHGSNSGKEYARQFSNIPQSNQSSLGFYETLSTYSGGHGYSLKLEGLEKGINDNANRRAIVMHAAAYVNESLVRSQGYIGRSWGCPALPENLYKPIIDKIKGGTCLFIYGQDNAYLQNSRIINA